MYAVEVLKKEMERIQDLLDGKRGRIVRVFDDEGPLLARPDGPDDPDCWDVGYCEDEKLEESLRVGDYVDGGYDDMAGYYIIEDAGSRELYEARLGELKRAIEILLGKEGDQQ